LTLLLSIAIVEDEPVYQSRFKDAIAAWADRSGNLVDIRTYGSGEKLFVDWEIVAKYHVLFLDIRLPGLNGMQIAEMLRAAKVAIPIVFLTNAAEYAVQGYEVQALYYLLKPVLPAQLDRCMEQVLAHSQSDSDYLMLPVDGVWHRIPQQEILYCDVNGHYVQLHTLTNTYSCRMTISDLKSQLSSSFFRCHRSVIVNSRHIHMMRGKELVLCDNRILPVSDTYYEDALSCLFRKYR
jgi:DNA-binding LytR/AlgR family response regulator